MKRNIAITIISIFIISIMLIIINSLIYGTNTIHIADYMPGGGLEVYNRKIDFFFKAITRLIFDMVIVSFVGIILVRIETKMLYKKKIFEENNANKILVLMLYILPILISGIKLYMQYGFTS